MKERQRIACSIALVVAALAVGCDTSFEQLTGAISPVPDNGVITGDALDYSLVFPQGWFERNFNTDPEWDREFVLPDKGAEVLVLAHREPEGTAYSINAFMRYMTDEADKVYGDFRVLERHNLSSKGAIGRLWHATGKFEGEPWHIYCAFYVRYNLAFAILAGAPTETFPEVEGELEQIIKSFELQTLRSQIGEPYPEQWRSARVR